MYKSVELFFSFSNPSVLAIYIYIYNFKKKFKSFWAQDFVKMGNFFGAAILTKVVVGIFLKKIPKKNLKTGFLEWVLLWMVAS